MRDLLASASVEAMMLTGARNHQTGTEFTPAGDYVELRLLYNPFEPEEVEVHELQFRENKSLAEYLGDLPEGTQWMVFYNGAEVQDLSRANETIVRRGDRIGVLVLPQGSNGLKSVLRIVLQAAAIALFFVAPGLGFLAVMAINIGVGLINAFLLTPKPPKMADNGQEANSYGIDGAKNSATEGIPYPVVYGEYRVAGNFADCFTENVGDDQYLYLRTVLNDGEVDWIGDIELNEQPLSNFKDVEVRTELGTLTQTANSWFGRSIVQKSKGVKLDTSWTYHKTTSQVDQLRLDLVFPQGLVNINEKDGKQYTRSASFEVQYRQVDAAGTPLTSFEPLPHSTPSNYYSDEAYGSPNPVNFAGLSRAIIAVKAPHKLVSDNAFAPRAQYREVGSSTWNDLEPIEMTQDLAAGYIYDGAGDAVQNGFTPHVSHLYDVGDLDGDYEFRGVDGAAIQQITAYPKSGSQSVRFSDSRTRQIRKSIETTRLDRGYYEVAIRRLTPQSTSQHALDEAHLTDIAEITCEPTNLRGTANLSLRVRLNEQLNQIPQVTCKVRCKVRQYDIEGNEVANSHTKNLAWHALDTLVGIERGAGIAKSRIDWPAWVDFAQFCEDNNLEFNGVFDTGSNIGDVLMEICRVGRAMPVPFGTKMSVAIDRPREPVMMFNSTNIIEDSFEMGYMSLNERANEYELSFFDKTDRNKQKTLRYVDPKAVNFNEMPRKASVTFRGIDNADQAKRELWRMIYANRLLVRTITFDAWLDAIAMSLGDVALIQHSMMEWAEDGKCGAGSTATQVVLDREVAMDGEPHAMLVHFDTVSHGSAVVNSIVGNKVLVPTSALSDPAAVPRMHRLRLLSNPAIDYEIVSFEKGSVYDTVTLATAPAGIASGATVGFFQNDVIVERDVTSVATAGGITTVTLAAALPGAPNLFSNFVFGKKVMVKKPYVLTGISGRGVERRTLSFVEYHEGVYAEPELEVPTPVTRVTDRQVDQVRGLLLDYEELIAADRTLINARIHWSSGHILNYGGADVYMALNGSTFRPLPSAVDVSEYHLQLAPGDKVAFEVVAFNKRGDRAPISGAPMISGNIAVTYAAVDQPTDLTADVVDFDVNGTVEFDWTEPADTTGVIAYELDYKSSAASTWVSAGRFTSKPVRVPGFSTGTWEARVRSVSANSQSDYATEPFTVVVQPGSVLANFNAGNDRNAAAIPAPTLPVASPVEHTINTDGSANISLEWEWVGDEASIDGFRIKVIEAAP